MQKSFKTVCDHNNQEIALRYAFIQELQELIQELVQMETVCIQTRQKLLKLRNYVNNRDPAQIDYEEVSCIYF